MDNIFYVYLHRRNDNNEVFYVGKGKDGRATSKSGRNEWWTRIVNKVGYSVEYLEKNLYEDDAFDLEIETIKFYVKCGHTLCNLTPGGEGGAGYRHKPEIVEQMKIRNRSDSSRENMRLKISKPVLCSNGMTFIGCKAAEIWLGNSPTSSTVSSCCRREVASANGFVWRYLSDCEDLQEILNQGKDAFIEFGCQAFLDKILPKLVYCDNGMVFDSARKASKWCQDAGMNVKTSEMSRCCLRKIKSIRGLQFSYVDEFNHTST